MKSGKLIGAKSNQPYFAGETKNLFEKKSL